MPFEVYDPYLSLYTYELWIEFMKGLDNKQKIFFFGFELYDFSEEQHLFDSL